MRHLPGTTRFLDQYALRCVGVAGFTLAEIMASLGVLLLLVVLFGRILTESTRAWSVGESNKEWMQNARAIGDNIGKELQAALLPINRDDIESLQFVVNPVQHESSGNLADFMNRDAVFWQAPVSLRGAAGDIAEIGYFVKWDSAESSHPKPQLCRFYVDEQLQIYSTPLAWLSEAIINNEASGGRASRYRGLFAENVVGLWIRCLDPRDQPIIQGTEDDHSFDSRRDYSYEDPTQIPQTVVRPRCSLPSTVDVSFALLDSQVAARLGKSDQNVISEKVRGSATADQFVSSANEDQALRHISGGLRAYRTKVYLQNSK